MGEDKSAPLRTDAEGKLTMPGTVLIVDGNTPRRILLRAKLGAAMFSTTLASCAAEAGAQIATRHPDLILVGEGLFAPHPEAFCQRLKADAQTSDIPVVLLQSGENRARLLSGLESGAEEVLSLPMSDKLFFAHLRSLIRARSGMVDLLQGDSARLAGFHEDPNPFPPAPRVLFLDTQPARATALRDRLPRSLKRQVRIANPMGLDPALAKGADILILRLDPNAPAVELQKFAQWRCQGGRRPFQVLVLSESAKTRWHLSLLDLGVDVVMTSGDDAQELTLRLKRLNREKQRRDRLQRAVETGLRASVRDSLTGLYNRRFALTRLQEIMQEGPCALLLLDIDHFKRINDRFGHLAGDRALWALAQRLQVELAPQDLLARIGGEEFLVLLPGLDQKRAKEKADRLCARVSVLPFDLPSVALPLSLTVSIGLTTHQPGQPGDAFDLLRRADQALYQAKAAGRNQVTLQRPAA